MKSKTIDIWEQTVKKPPEAYKEYFVDEKEFLKQNISKEDVVLDLGCGTGRSMKELAHLVKKFIGIDNDSTAIESAKKNLKDIENIEIFLEDGEKIHFKNKSIDVVFIGLTFCNFIESKMVVLLEIKRILKDNGLFIFSVFNEDSLKIRLKHYTEQYDGHTILDERKGLVRFDKDGGLSEHFSKQKITQILNKAGFSILNITKDKLAYLIKAKKR